MRRITLYFATALFTFIVGSSFEKTWNSLFRGALVDSLTVGSEGESGHISSSAFQQELVEIEHQHDIAQTNQDAAFFERLETDNFILTFADGSTLTRSQDIALMKSWDPRI